MAVAGLGTGRGIWGDETGGFHGDVHRQEDGKLSHMAMREHMMAGRHTAWRLCGTIAEWHDGL